MAAIAFDTLKLARKLEAAGFTALQAAGAAEALAETVQDAYGIATKADVYEVRREIVDSRAEILKWMFTAALAQVGATVALLKAL